jgi:hypothetical protein
MRSKKIYEQVDCTNGKFLYSWIFDVPYLTGKNFSKWKWTKGNPGCFVCNDYSVAKETSEILHIPIESNGTHSVFNAPMFVP